MGDVPPGGDEPLIHALVREGVEELLEQGLIADLDRAEQQLQAGTGGLSHLKVLRILPLDAGNEGLVGVDEMKPPGLLDKIVPEAGMSYGYQVHGPLSDALAVQISYAVFGYHIMNIAPGEGDSRPLFQERHYAGYQWPPG